MQYQIQFSAAAAKELKKLPKEVQLRLGKKILLLSDDPRPPGIKALQGQADILRLRIGDYRVIYQVNDENTLIRILKIGHRREIYRGL